MKMCREVTRHFTTDDLFLSDLWSWDVYLLFVLSVKIKNLINVVVSIVLFLSLLFTIRIKNEQNFKNSSTEKKTINK